MGIINKKEDIGIGDIINDDQHGDAVVVQIGGGRLGNIITLCPVDEDKDNWHNSFICYWYCYAGKRLFRQEIKDSYIVEDAIRRIWATEKDSFNKEKINLPYLKALKEQLQLWLSDTEVEISLLESKKDSR